MGFGLGLRSHSGKSLVQLLPYRLCMLARHPNLAIGALNRRLDQVDGYVGCSQPVPFIRPMQKK